MAPTQAKSQQKLDQLSLALDSGTFVDVRRMLNGLAPPDVAHLLESSPPKFRRILWQLVEVEQEGEVLGGFECLPKVLPVITFIIMLKYRLCIGTTPIIR